MTLVSGNINYFRYSKVFLRLLSSNWGGGEFDEFAVFPMLYLPS